MKKAIRYLRFSHDGQSNSSIEKQDLYTSQWLERNNVQLTDTFIDAGHSAKTFDRPDFIKPQSFINTHHRQVDYLVVDQMDRFSRDAGEAMSLVKKLQLQYAIQIVSVTEGITFDYNTPGSFFRAGLQLLLAEEDNINRTNKINGGIYTAKAKEGRYIHGTPPFGYTKSGNKKTDTLVIDDNTAQVVRFIFDAFLRGTPLYEIRKEALSMGFTGKGNSSIPRILQNPIYAGMQFVKPFKELPGGLFPAVHAAIIDADAWYQVQDRFKKPVKTRTILSNDTPLRGLLKCHCGRTLTAAPSRGRWGKYYSYYKCQVSGHNNISANFAHDQLLQILELISLPHALIKEIRKKSVSLFEEREKNNNQLVITKKQELAAEEAKLVSLEEKWITNKVNYETYSRWFAEINRKRTELRLSIERLSASKDDLYSSLYKHLDCLGDLKFVYLKCTVAQKHELLRTGFDSQLYYQNRIYRTPFLSPVLPHNVLKMKERRLLEVDELKKKRD